eukprot:TRINITY_DN1181_c0_g1_i1.p1 TRINITY_DN1181_c0_g1~~TRINITY_DN1181_c0_g1_i1.p1  ORF type:complete len:136 (+),score=22.97 TRINITY_DN1181_c0_g1_i1:77-484(+)
MLSRNFIQSTRIIAPTVFSRSLCRTFTSPTATKGAEALLYGLDENTANHKSNNDSVLANTIMEGGKHGAPDHTNIPPQKPKPYDPLDDYVVRAGEHNPCIENLDKVERPALSESALDSVSSKSAIKNPALRTGSS